MKKIISIILSAVMLTALFAVPVSAEETEKIEVPQIRVTTEDGNGTTLQKDDGYVKAEISITDTDGSVLSDSVKFKVRGNTTALSWMLKKPFTFKFDKKKNVLGLGKGKKWALIANAFDPTLLRSCIAFDIADELGLEYTSQRKVVELWVDGSFRGCYMLFEPVQEGGDRVDIDIESNDGKKDFLLEYEAQRVEDDVTYMTSNGLRFIISEPEEPDDEQFAYIKGVTDGIISTIRRGDKAEISEKIDVPSFAKFYLLNEYLKTFDFDMSSVFFYYKDGKLYAGPPWDFDLSAGNENPDFSTRAANSAKTEGLFANSGNIYKYLCKCDWFYDEVRSVYKEHSAYFDNIACDGGLLDSTRAEYQSVIDRNYSEAGWYITKWWLNNIKKPLATYEANYTYLKEWLADRQAWLSDYYKLSAEDYMVGDADGDGRVTINDVSFIQRYLADYEQELPPCFEKACAISSDKVSIDAATYIQLYLSGRKSAEDIGTIKY